MKCRIPASSQEPLSNQQDEEVAEFLIQELFQAEVNSWGYCMPI